MSLKKSLISLIVIWSTMISCSSSQNIMTRSEIERAKKNKNSYIVFQINFRYDGMPQKVSSSKCVFRFTDGIYSPENLEYKLFDSYIFVETPSLMLYLSDIRCPDLESSGNVKRKNLNNKIIFWSNKMAKFRYGGNLWIDWNTDMTKKNYHNPNLPTYANDYFDIQILDDYNTRFLGFMKSIYLVKEYYTINAINYDLFR